MGDHQHHHSWHFPLRVCLAVFAPSHHRQFLSQAAAKRKQNISIKPLENQIHKKTKIGRVKLLIQPSLSSYSPLEKHSPYHPCSNFD